MMEQTEKPSCPVTHECAFYQKSKAYMPTISQRLKNEYCVKSFRECACWRLFNTIGAEWAPLDMLPYQHERAKQILNEVGEGHEPIVASLPVASCP